MDSQQSLPPSTGDIREDSTFKILVASDIHLGYSDNNPARENDSFTTFEEILKLGRDENVDFVLLGGDLFHENKPKPVCLHKTVQIMRTYCLGSKPVEFEYMGDPSVNFPHQDTPEVNYQNPDINIALPVFTIHGNHDDPIGVKKTSAVDHLVAAKLLNHFGQWDDLNEITIMPVPLIKGETKLALYGLGNLKDERLFRLIRDQHVKFIRPKESQEDWFNLFVLHQNRIRHGAKNYIPESYIPPFFDLAIWGHEHECRIEPEPSEADVKTYIVQPGSSVATSLCSGEAKEKFVGILHINQRRFRMEKRKLQTVRPLLCDDIILKDVLPNLDKDKTPGKTVEKYVESRVKALLTESLELLTGHEKQPVEPLIRIRVFHERTEDAFNPVRFAQKFSGQVINDDIVMFKRVLGKREGGGEMDVEDMDHMILAHHEDLDSHVETIVEAFFIKAREEEDHASILEVLSERGLSEAVKSSVEKDDKEALTAIVELQMEKAIEYLMKKQVTEDNIDEELENFRVARLAQPDQECKEAMELLKTRQPKKTRPASNENESGEDEAENGHDSEGDQDNEERTVIDDDDDDEPSVVGFGRSRGRGRGRGQQAAAAASTTRGRGRGRGRGKANGNDSFDTSPPAPKSRGRGRGSTTATASKARGKTATAAGSRSMVQTTLQVRRSPRKTKGAMVFDDTDSD